MDPTTKSEMMRLYGYVADAAADQPSALGEVTLVAQAETLRRVAAFLLHAADEMERHGSLFGHEHLVDFDRDYSGPDIVVHGAH